MKKSTLTSLLLASCLVNGLLLFLLKPIKVKPKLSKPIQVKIKYKRKEGSAPFPAPLLEVLKDKGLTPVFDVKGYDYDILYDTACTKPSLYNYIKSPIKIAYTGEAYNRPDVNNYDLSIGFDYSDHPKYARLPYGFIDGCGSGSNGDPNKFNTRGMCNPNKEFACFLVSKGKVKEKCDATELRVKAFHAFSLYKKVLSGGKLLNNVGGPVPGNKTMDFLSKCKFVIAYENQAYPGYLTEKVFNAYFAGAVPIYYGHPTVLNDINKKAVIYAGDFHNLDEVVEYVKKVDNNDKLYCSIYKENIVKHNRCDLMVNSLKQKFCKLVEEKLVKENLRCEYY